MNRYLIALVLIAAYAVGIVALNNTGRANKTTLIPKDIKEGDILEVKYTDSGVIQLDYPVEYDDYFMVVLRDSSLMWVSPIERAIITEKPKRVKFYPDLETLLNEACKIINQ